MAYKKYIKKNGKIYGPYLYHSRRVNDKVISEYYGHQKKRNYKNIIISVSLVLVVFLVIYGISYVKPFFSGKAIFNLDTNYQEGKPLDGFLKLSLKQGEMIPSSAKVIFNNNGNIMEYPLSELVFEEETSEGEFYVQGKDISGEGEGYGIVGERVVYPVVHFNLNVYSTNSSETEVSGEGGLEEETPIEAPTETPTETPAETSTEEPTENPVETPTETPVETSTEEPTETPVETPTETLAETSTSETPAPADSNKDKKEDKIKDSTSSTSQSKETSSASSQSKEDKKSSDTSSETTSAPAESPAPSITGNIISIIFKGISNLFLGLTGTGKVALDVEKTIEANVSSGNLFSYNLQDGESAELKKGSVYIIDSEGKERKIDDSYISLDTTKERIIVDTDYSEVEQGFGEEYLGNKEKTIYLNLSSLNLVFEKGSLSILLAYENQEIVSLVTSLEQGKITTNETLAEIPILNETIFLNQTNQTLEDAMKFVSSAELSEEEKAELFAYFGNFSITTTKSEIFNGRLIRNYKLGDYEIEYSYEYSGLITSKLEEQMQRDLMKWLRDILTEISKKEAASESIESLLGNSSLENKINVGEEVPEENFTEEILENSTI